MIDGIDWEKIAPDIAIQILGEPSKKMALTIVGEAKATLNLEQGTFFDFENNQGYGLIEFIKNRGLNPDDFLKEYKPIEPAKPTRTFTDKDMYQLKLSLSFICVTLILFWLWFREHFIKQNMHHLQNQKSMGNEKT